MDKKYEEFQKIIDWSKEWYKKHSKKPIKNDFMNNEKQVNNLIECVVRIKISNSKNAIKNNLIDSIITIFNLLNINEIDLFEALNSWKREYDEAEKLRKEFNEKNMKI